MIESVLAVVGVGVSSIVVLRTFNKWVDDWEDSTHGD